MKSKLASVSSELRGDLTGARWVRPDNLHVTLLFLGRVEDSRLKDVCSHLKEVGQSVEPWRARVKAIGVFPTPERPRVLWAGVEGGRERFDELYGLLCGVLGPFCEKAAMRTFTPHITLARFKGRPGGRVSEVIEQYSNKDWGALAVAELTLFESQLSPKGAKYIPLYRVRF